MTTQDAVGASSASLGLVPDCFERAVDCRRTDTESCAGEHLGRLDLAQVRAQHLDLLYKVAHKIREPVDGHAHLNQG